MANISIKKAALINFIAKYSNILIQLLVNCILARILTPDDYGIVAVITVFISFFTMIADMGIGPAIIQNKELSNRDVSEIFTFTILTGVIISIIFALFSYPLSKIYDNNVYIYLGMILSISILFNILNIVPNSLLLKEKKFKTLGVRTIIINFLCGMITIALALVGAKYYSLVINSLLVGFFTFSINCYGSNLKIKFSFSSIKKIKQFSSYQFSFNFINYFSRNLDNLLIGKFMGQVPLGYYDKAYKLMLYPVSNLTFVITPVLHPILSDYQNDKDIIYEKYIKVVKLLALLGAFISVYCFFSADEIIRIMFGNQWGTSVASFKILSISICVQMVLSSSGTIFQATNETKKMFYAGLLGAGANILMIIIGVLKGKIEYVAIGVVIAYMLNFITCYYLLIKKVFNRKLTEFMMEFRSTILILVICSLFMVIFEININNCMISAAYKFVICGSGYVLSLYLTKEINMFLSILGLDKKRKIETTS
ncbi:MULTISPECIES: lipopolysaccharide biosynthesis protein [Clostridium]|jgi:PST family polysaccharide transporter|uniref:Lipopolysaccharide biosynthesis protein n=3 Tax=root TaxID=1 RepID=A0AAP9UER8_CLOBU|nr:MULTISPECIES: lipopolysaccharide biosynthesis protein [Clostridium]EMU55279.1 hypothetical protein CBDKU1_08910 [Clostridium butyricum DKU-01]MBZ5747455.1 lipopolysaccharide biosynthesis protein [Clostridium butyricum]MDI9208380.1 lipopolysaccharide biosynthesis protein [Clostridium butyricum]MDU6039186.1 lipopolysaccharide biosynthesis protein [Clostridium butyricum]QMW91526.1 lipopolysaccharide biosynthesis protein [Clostridium butyricum]